MAEKSVEQIEAATRIDVDNFIVKHWVRMQFKRCTNLFSYRSSTDGK